MPTRRTVIGAVAAGVGVSLAGCSGDERSTATATPGDNPVVGAVQQRGDLRLTSEAFEDGGPIPARYSRDGENVNPPLSVTNLPDEAATLALVVDDPDAVAVAGEVFLHWLVWNVPANRTTIPADWTPSEAVVGENDFGNRRYDGPAPPDGEHTYRFKCFALDRALELPGTASKRDVGAAMDGHILAQTQLTGTYAP